MHADHMLDLVPLRYALVYGERSRDERLRIYLPPDGPRVLGALAAALGSAEEGPFFDDVFEIATYDPNEPLQIGSLGLRFAQTAHFIPTFAIRCDQENASLTYSADTAPCDALVALARDTNLFLCEATLTRDEEAHVPRGHSSAREAGAMAQAASAKSLALTHYPAARNPATLAAEAAETYPGPITIVDDGRRLEVSNS